MRRAGTFTEGLFTLRRLEDCAPSDHPLRLIRQMVNKALVNMDVLFAGMYEAQVKGGRPRIAPEKLLRAMLPQVFYSVRPQRQPMEQSQCNWLFRWFTGQAKDAAVRVPAVFTKNRERLIAHDAVIELFNLVLAQADRNGLAALIHQWLQGSTPRRCAASQVGLSVLTSLYSCLNRRKALSRGMLFTDCWSRRL